MQLLKKDKIVGKVLLIDLERIGTNPAQPRIDFPEEQLLTLAQSIAENGLLQPITVRKKNDAYELISGERRLRACKMIGEDKIQAIVIDKTEQESAILALIENLHRQDLNIFEQAIALKNLLLDWNVTQEQAALKLGMAQSTLANKVRLLQLSEDEQRKILQLQLTERHARALLKVSAPDKRAQILRYIEEKELNVSQTEQLIGDLLEIKHKKTYIPLIKDVRLFINTINKAIHVMKSAGIPALSERIDQEEYIQYIIKIPKKPQT